jgi:hypothetical protein
VRHGSTHPRNVQRASTFHVIDANVFGRSISAIAFAGVRGAQAL